MSKEGLHEQRTAAIEQFQSHRETGETNGYKPVEITEGTWHPARKDRGYIGRYTTITPAMGVDDTPRELERSYFIMDDDVNSVVMRTVMHMPGKRSGHIDVTELAQISATEHVLRVGGKVETKKKRSAGKQPVLSFIPIVLKKA